MFVKLVTKKSHSCSAQAHALESRFYADRANMPMRLNQIVRGHDRSAVQESSGIGRIRGRCIQSPDFRRQHGVDAAARLDCSSYAKDTTAAPDPGHPCIAEHPAERVVEHFQTNEGIVGDGKGIRAVSHRPGGDPRRLGNLFSVTEPQNLVIIHHKVLPDRLLIASEAPTVPIRMYLTHRPVGGNSFVHR